MTVGLVVDHSTSMHRKLTDVIAAARTFVRSSNHEDEMFVVNFNEKVTLGLPAAIRFTNRIDELESAILRAPTLGLTALYDAVAAGLERLQAGSRDKKVPIVISDGGDNASAHTLAGVLRMTEQSSALVYTTICERIARDIRNRYTLAGCGKRLSTSLSRTQTKVCATCYQQLATIWWHRLQPVEAFFRSLLGYVPTKAAQPGVSRSIRVNARAAGYGKLSVRTRSGYIARGEPRLVKDEGEK